MAARDEAIAALKYEHKMTGWILSFVGFLTMWIGLSLCLGRINAVLDVLPLLGSIGRGVISIAMFVVGLVLSLVTIVVSMIVHNPIAPVIAVAILIGPGFLIGRLFKKKKAAPPANA